MSSQGRHSLCREQKVGPQVGYDSNPHPKNGTIDLHPCFHVDSVAPGMKSNHVLLPVLYLFDGAPQGHRQIRYRNLLWEQDTFFAETPSYIGRNAPDLIVGTVEEFRQMLL